MILGQPILTQIKMGLSQRAYVYYELSGMSFFREMLCHQSNWPAG
jgi:hypothetical protein